MARAPNEKLNKALSLYQKGYKLIDIAKELDIPDGTVRRWKNTYNWDSERSERKSERSEKKKVSNRKKNKESIADFVNGSIGMAFTSPARHKKSRSYWCWYSYFRTVYGC